MSNERNETTVADVWGIVANARADSGNARFRKGALVWLVLTTGGGLFRDRGMFRGLSQGGRKITSWMAFKNLENFRVKWVPEAERGGMYGVCFTFETREQAQTMIDRITDPSGKVLQHD